MLTLGFNPWGQMVLQFGTSLDVPKSKISCPIWQSMKAATSLSFWPVGAKQRRVSGDDRWKRLILML
jgi:hypothetical protein